jgi:hypothetical protein
MVQTFNINRLSNFYSFPNMVFKWLCIVFILFLLCNCKSKCLDSYIRENQNDHLYIKVKNVVVDSLNMWMVKKVRLIQSYKLDEWRLDGLVFNNAKDRYVGWLVCIDSDKGVLLDRVDMIAGEIDSNSKISVYYGGILPTIYYEKSNSENIHRLEQLSKLVRMDLIKGGIISNYSCNISDKYIDSWFVNKPELIKHHKEFLNDVIDNDI